MPKEENTKTAANDTNAIKNINDRLLCFQRVRAAEKIFFVQHLAVMLKAGISLSKALEILAQQTTNRRLQKIIVDLHRQTAKGQTLADSLALHKNIFNELFINMVAAGEASGTLEEALRNFSVQLKKNHSLAGKIRGALMYPLVVVSAMAVIGTGIVIFVVPKFIGIFQDAKLELPLMTKMLIAASEIIVNNGLMAGIIIVIILAAILQLLHWPSGKKGIDFILLKLPVIGPIIKKINVTRFARTMSSLLKTDIKITESFKITATTVTNFYYRQSLLAAAEKVKKGINISQTLSAYPQLYNQDILQMIMIGEETGELDKILEEIADFYEEEVEEIMNTLPTIIEPLIVILLAVAIGAMAVAIIMPMYSLTNAF